MPANPVASKDMVFSTDYPLDKVILIFENSVSVGAFGFADVDTPHTLGVTPLVSAQWTTDPTWALSYEIGTGLYVNGSPSYSTGIAADSGKVRFSLNNNLGSGVTIYYRVYALSPDNNSSVSAVATNQYNDFQFNTDFNYPKLFLVGTFTEPSTGGVNVTRILGVHNLGYIPQVACWQTVGAFTSPVLGSDETSGNIIEVTASSLIVTFNSFSSTTIYYRIYLDE